MGEVYKAYDPKMNRGIALKIMTAKIYDLAKFEKSKARLIREAQALAQLAHPNIVAVHDYGEHDEDIFIAMELVEGKTLKEWLREDAREIGEVLEIMIAAGEGLSAAHKAGLIHRDFKPQNVIIGNDGRVRVLDFGLVYVSEHKSNISPGNEDDQNKKGHEYENSSDLSHLGITLTAPGVAPGTPPYMSPEQHVGIEIDHKSDQYSFCVVLFEAFYGQKPFLSRTMEDLRKEKLEKQITIPTQNANVPAWLREIVLKGLNVIPKDRFDSIEALLEELRNDPEEKSKQRRAIRNRKMMFVALVILAIVLPVGVWYGLQYRKVQSCKNATEEQADVWNEATKETVKRNFLASNKTYAQWTWEQVDKNVNTYLGKLSHMRGEVCEARWIRGTQSEELFDLRMSCLKKRNQELKSLINVFVIADAKVVEQAAQASLSLTGINTCADEKALRAAFEPPKTAEAKKQVASIRQRLTEVEAFSRTGQYEKGLELARRLRKKAEEVDYRPLMAEVLFWLGEVLERAGKYKQAENILHDAVREAGDNRDALLAARAMTWLVRVVGYQQARYEEGLIIARDAKTVLSIAGGDDRIQANLFNSLGAVFRIRADYDQALENFHKTLTIMKKVLGPEHPEVASTLNNIGLVLNDQGEFARAVDAYRKALAIREKVLGPEHPKVATTLNNIGIVFRNMGDWDNSLVYLEKSKAIIEKVLGPAHPHLAALLHNIGIVFSERDDSRMALKYFREALAIEEKALGADHPQVAYILIGIGESLRAQNEYDKALEQLRKALRILEKALGADHPLLASPLIGIGGVFLDQGKPKQALNPLERVVRICDEEMCDQNTNAIGRFTLARALVLADVEIARAKRLAKAAQALFEKNPKAFKKELIEVNHLLQEH